MTNWQITWAAAGLLTLGLAWSHHNATPVQNTASSAAAVEAENQNESKATVSKGTVQASESQTSPNPTPTKADTKTKLSSAEVKKQMDRFEETIERLNRCYSEDCVPETVSPPTANYEAGQNIKLELMKLRDFVQANDLTDSRVSNVAIQALDNSDGHVQTVALDLLASQPTSSEALDAILEKVVRGYDAEMIEQAFKELQRYDAPASQEKIRQYLAEEMVTGAPFVSQAIAQHIHPFLNSESVSLFQATSEKIGPGTITYDRLQASLKEFQNR
jgi:hypothetical protein